MSFNINTATNAELRNECDRLQKKYTTLQQDVIEKWKKMYELSEEYTKIKTLLDKREGKANGTTKG